jgi:hypothetical protein
MAVGIEMLGQKASVPCSAQVKPMLALVSESGSGLPPEAQAQLQLPELIWPFSVPAMGFQAAAASAGKAPQSDTESCTRTALSSSGGSVPRMLCG